MIEMLHSKSEESIKEPLRFNHPDGWHEGPWEPIAQIVDDHEKFVTKAWNSDLDEMEAYMVSRGERGGGLAGIDDEFYWFKSQLIRRGKELLKAQGEQERLERRAHVSR